MGRVKFNVERLMTILMEVITQEIEMYRDKLPDALPASSGSRPDLQADLR